MNPTTVSYLLLISICAGSASANHKNASASDSTILIVGGSKAEEKEFPYQLSLQINSRSVCGASLVAPDYVLTAAHCAVLASPSDFVVLGGGITFKGETIQTRHVKNVKIHPGFNRVFWAHDIAIMELSSPFDTNEYVKPIQIAAKLDPNLTGNAVVTGWGATREGGFPSLTLSKVTLPIVDHKLCSEIYDGWVKETMHCAGLIEGGKDSCQGDSGGPLAINRNGEYIQIGVVSFGNGCAREGFPGVYTDLSKYRDWLNTVLV